MQISAIPAIGPIVATNMKSMPKVQNQMACQPLKKSHDYEFAMPFKSVHHNQDGDVAELDSDVSLEEKYDFACRLAAYYQQQYENLKLKGCIEA